jgi:Na+/H+ antiporter NhaA
MKSHSEEVRSIFDKFKLIVSCEFTCSVASLHAFFDDILAFLIIVLNFYFFAIHLTVKQLEFGVCDFFARFKVNIPHLSKLWISHILGYLIWSA